ncbi:MAG: phospholipid carrier-dependent glycosyltransferase [Chthoniobacterales bacterium]|nr:phospholipid carrier-dependent glycosyltransferase [Chthoniobacterales bacterium]
MESDQRRTRTRDIVALCVVLAVGAFLRLPSPLFSTNGGPLRALGALHPAPGFQNVGFDEGLYRGYVEYLIQHSVTSYPEIAELFVEVQSNLPSAILPPTRFLYIFTSYLWHVLSGADALTSLHNISSLFGVLMLCVATLFAWRLGGLRIAICIAALMSCAPTQIHMSQHALIDGFFAFWATLSVWLLWENLRKPGDLRWLVGLGAALALLVLTKENAMFVYIGLLGLLCMNYPLHFGTITKGLLATMVLGPLVGVTILVNLCGSLETTYRIYTLLVSKASVLPYAIATGDGPWYRYLVDLMIMSPVVLVLAIGGIFQLKLSQKAPLFLLTFVAASYLLMANVRYGMNLRYANIWDMPLRYFATLCLINVSDLRVSRANLWLGLMIAAVCVIELRQYLIFFVEHDLYELVTGGLLHAVKILK